jgi:iron complex outermembrane receptor protein
LYDLISRATRSGPYVCAWAVLAGVLACADAPRAAPADALLLASQDTEELYLGEIPLVLSGTRLRQPLNESPLAVSVIDREMIEASGAREIPDLFRLVPGMLVGSVNGHDRDVGYLGLLDAYSRRMQVLIDGRSAYDPALGGINWSTLPITVDDVERIEVVRGPNAASYGTNAFLATILITTRHRLDEGRTHATVRTGSDGVFDAHAGFGRLESDWAYHLTFAHREDSGFDNLKDGKRVNSVLGHFSRDLGGQTLLEIEGGYSDSALGEDDAFGRRMSDASEGFVQGQWLREWGTDDALRLFGSYGRAARDDSPTASETFNLGLPFVLTATPRRNREVERANLELEHRFRASDSLRGLWGGEVRHDEAEDDFDFGPGVTVENDLYRLFGHLEWQVTGTLQASLGAMVEESDLADAEISPRFGLIYSPSPRHSFRASVSQAHRTPVLFEADADQVTTARIVDPPPQGGCDLFYAIGYGALGLGAPPSPAPCEVQFIQNWSRGDLDPEEITSYEIGHRFSTGFDGIPGRLSSDIKVYRKEIDDLLTSERTDVPLRDGLLNLSPNTFDFNNVVALTIDGIEGSLEWRPQPDTRILATLSFADAEAEADNASSREHAETVPESMGSLLLMHRFAGGLATSLLFSHVSEMTFLGLGQPIDPVTRIDARAAWPLRSGTTRGEFAVMLQNLGEEYQDFTQANVVGTRVLVSLRLETP